MASVDSVLTAPARPGGEQGELGREHVTEPGLGGSKWPAPPWSPRFFHGLGNGAAIDGRRSLPAPCRPPAHAAAERAAGGPRRDHRCPHPLPARYRRRAGETECGAPRGREIQFHARKLNPSNNCTQATGRQVGRPRPDGASPPRSVLVERYGACSGHTPGAGPKRTNTLEQPPPTTLKSRLYDGAPRTPAV